MRHQGAFRNVIVSFDMEDEAFRELPMPKNLQGEQDSRFMVARLDGLLALLWPDMGFHSLWVMKEYGVAESWIKLFNINIAQGLQEVLGFTKNGELLLIHYGSLISYEPSQQTWYFHFGLFDWLSLDTYVESLVLLNISTRYSSKKKERRISTEG
ncbi:F-box/kelch-repeat protein At3g06240-like [Corylus avellana]|uniref:F-box/kelch-repeat protein At3g06240-like n=1 Tax=Corylus avellana TaxID=13451 RepID=UPI00286B538F|nr:F-box/kelch-repeat protein At3g06240-like [Corylus avellana]